MDRAINVLLDEQVIDSLGVLILAGVGASFRRLGALGEVNIRSLT